MKKKNKTIYLLPNIFTSFSLLSGFYSILSTFQRQWEQAAFAILIASLFDMIDGRIARVTGSESRFGREYDSLSDAISFGIAPSLLLYFFVLNGYGRFGWLTAFLFLACGILRLARFNIQADTIQKKKFVGLPIPAAASMIASSLLLFSNLSYEIEFRNKIIPILVLFLSFLMVSEIRYPSLKNIKFPKKKPFHTALVSMIFLIIVLLEPRLTFFLLMVAYILSGPIGLIFKKRIRSQELFSNLKET